MENTQQRGIDSFVVGAEIWGWGGYFCELDREFQKQIIKRHRYGE